MKTIQYLVTATHGEYSDHNQRNICLYASEHEAKDLIEKLNLSVKNVSNNFPIWLKEWEKDHPKLNYKKLYGAELYALKGEVRKTAMQKCTEQYQIFDKAKKDWINEKLIDINALSSSSFEEDIFNEIKDIILYYWPDLEFHLEELKLIG